jgi:hypothetical protein
MYKTEWTLEGSSNCCLNFTIHYYSNYWIGILPMVFWRPPIHGILTPPYPWYFDPLTMEYRSPYTWYFNPLPMVYRPPYHGILTPIPLKYRTPTHDILTPLPMIYLPPINGIWPPTDGILSPLPMIYRPPIHGILTPYWWHIDPPTHGILTHLSMVYWPPYPWYIDHPIHGILIPLPMEYRPHTHDMLTSLPITWLEMGDQNTMGVEFTIPGAQFSIRGFNIPWIKIDPVVNLPWGSKYHMTPGHNIFVFRDRLLYR